MCLCVFICVDEDVYVFIVEKGRERKGAGCNMCIRVKVRVKD